MFWLFCKILHKHNSETQWLNVLIFCKELKAGCQGLTPIILATQEAEIRNHSSKPAPANSLRDPILKKKPSQNRAGGVAQGVGPEFKPQ
jgi:hypothetical protein